MPSWKKVITSGSDACLNSITVDSTTVVTNLNADKVDGCDASAFYLATNPSGFTSCTGTVTSVGTTGTVNGITLTGTVTTSGNLTLGGTLGDITVSQLSAAAIQTSGESFSDSDSVLMTAAAVNDRIESFGYTTCTGTVDGTGAANYIAYWTDSNTISGESNLYWDDTNNRLGICTTSPSHQLHVKGTGTQYGVWEKTDATTGFIAFFAGTGQAALFNEAGTRFRFGNGTSTAGAGFKDIFEVEAANNFVVNQDGDSDIDFRVESDTNANMLFVDGGANAVGIGTNSLTDTLNVAGTVKATSDICTDTAMYVGTNIVHVGDTNTCIGFGTDIINLTTGAVEKIGIRNTLIEVNTDEADVDFHVKGNAITTLLYGDAGTGRVGIGTDSPSRQFHVYNDTTNAFGLFERAVPGAEGWLAFWGGNGVGNIYTLAGDRLQLGVADNTGGSNFDAKITINSSGHVILNESGNDQDFRVETSGNSNMLFVDGGNDQVGIGTNTTSETLTVKGNTEVSGSIISPNFTAGLLGGDGYKLSLSDTVGCTALEVDNLLVRGRLSVVEFLAQQIRATNGTLFVTSTGKVETVETAGSEPSFTACITTPTGSNHGFAVGDRIRAQRFDGFGNVYQSDLTVTAVPNPFAFTASYQEAASEPQPGYEYVRLGNNSDTDRQGGIILSSDLDDSPYIKIYDEVNEHSGIFSDSKTKVLVGNLSSHNSTTFGCLSGSGGSPNYGFYASGSAYLEGSINATGGEIGGITICNTSISASNGGFEIKSDGSATFASGQITFESDGDITSNEYLVERSRVFGDGSDGCYTVNTTFSSVAGLFNVSSGTGFKTACLLRDAYFCNLTVVGTGICSVFIKSNGYRIFVKDTLMICSFGFIENNGNAGSNGQNASFEFQGSEGNGGAGTNTGTLLRGTSGGAGGEGGGDA